LTPSCIANENGPAAALAPTTSKLPEVTGCGKVQFRLA